MKSLYFFALIGAVLTGVAYWRKDTQMMRKLRRNLFIGGTFSRLLAKQFVRKLGFAR